MEEIHVQVETPQESLTNTPPPPPTKDHRHVCSYCQASFRRDEHLQRHIRIHTGEKKYRCPCKMSFARSDVFIRHLRICQPDLSETIQNSSRKTRSLNKTKRACDACAKSKAKCNYRIPCDRCSAKSIKCDKTRQGYEDPYAVYSIMTPASMPPSTTAEVEPEQIVQQEYEVDHVVDNGAEFGPVVTIPSLDPNVQPVSETTCISESETTLCQEVSDNGQNAMGVLVLPPSPQMTHEQDNSPLFMDQTSILADYDPAGNHCNLGLDSDPASLQLACFDNLDLLFNPQSQYEAIQGYDFFSFQQMPTHFISNGGFTLERLDPLRGKCDDIIELLKRADSHDNDQTIYSYITRDNMVHLCHLYGKNFQQNMSIIHAPTFDMAKSEPTLLLAVMLVGACYSPDTIPASHVVKLARRLLTAIGLEPDETNMGCPSMALIQAGVLVCCVLSCSNDRTALRSIRISVARNISMCERAGLLDPVEPVDYSTLTEETFDWNLWIQQETGKRLACETFCQNMAHCIFLGRAPDFDPCSFHVELPMYESCWEAGTAAECLHNLQSLPRPMRVSTAMTMLLSWPDADAPLFEASGFGMFVLVNGLHFCLHQATQVDKDTGRCWSVIPDMESANAIKRLKEDFTGPNITAIADKVLKVHASLVIRKVDNALNVWRSTWELRSNRDSKHEHCTFKGDPLPFWWLAKLYLLLHYHGHVVQPDSEYASPRAEGPDNTGKTKIQKKVVEWLSSFRGKKLKLDVEKENWLPDLMKLAHEEVI